MAASENDWQKNIQHWQQTIDALSQRERVLVFGVTIAIVVMLFQILLLDPVLAERQQAQSQIEETQNKIAQHESQKMLLEAELQAGVDRNHIRRRSQLQAELDKLNQQIETSVVAMIPPKLMAEVLEQLLVESKGLKLLSLENKPVVALVGNDKQQASQQGVAATPKANQQALYNHSFVLQLNGNYLDAIKYFERLSELPWRFYWDDLKYKVDTYPNAVITLEVHTVSMSEEWIGV